MVHMLVGQVDADLDARAREALEVAALIVEAQRTTTATRFRDGDVNLHFVHVARETRGKSCQTCHDPHATSRPKLVRDDVAYGSHGWRLKIGFEPTDTGGGCAKTCHVVKRYTR